MGEKIEVGCARPTGGPVGSPPLGEAIEEKKKIEKEITKMSAQVGKKAPDFQAPAFHEGKIKQIKLSDYLGKWIVLCFYPGDFTFV